MEADRQRTVSSSGSSCPVGFGAGWFGEKQQKKKGTVVELRGVRRLLEMLRPPAEVWQAVLLFSGLVTTIVCMGAHVVAELTAVLVFSAMNAVRTRIGKTEIHDASRFSLSYTIGDARGGLDILDERMQQRTSIVWYRGVVRHLRLSPVRHEFVHSCRLALVSLDRPPAWFTRDEERLLKTHTKTSAKDMSGQREGEGQKGGRAHALGKDEEEIGRERGWLTASEVRAMLGVPKSRNSMTEGKENEEYEAWVLCMPAAASFIINPIAVYYCFRVTAAGTRKLFPRCIAEVTSEPWTDKVRFVFAADDDVVPKCLHVSPFFDVNGMSWRLRTAVDTETDRVSLRVDVMEKRRDVPRHNDTNGESIKPLTQRANGHRSDVDRGTAPPAPSTSPSLSPDTDESKDDKGAGTEEVFKASLFLYPDSSCQHRAEKLIAEQVVQGDEKEAHASRRLIRVGSLRTMFEYGFQPQRACLAIYYHALLLLLKGLSLRTHPPFESLVNVVEKHNDRVLEGRRVNGPFSAASSTTGEGLIVKLPRPPWPWGVY